MTDTESQQGAKSGREGFGFSRRVAQHGGHSGSDLMMGRDAKYHFRRREPRNNLSTGLKIMKTPITDQVRYNCNDKAQLSGWCFRSAYESMTKHAEQLERKLAVERALTDRLAGEIESWASIAGDYTPMSADKAIAAWKEARNPAQTTTEGAE